MFVISGTPKATCKFIAVAAIVLLNGQKSSAASNMRSTIFDPVAKELWQLFQVSSVFFIRNRVTIYISSLKCSLSLNFCVFHLFSCFSYTWFYLSLEENPLVPPYFLSLPLPSWSWCSASPVLISVSVFQVVLFHNWTWQPLSTFHQCIIRDTSLDPQLWIVRVHYLQAHS